MYPEAVHVLLRVSSVASRPSPAVITALVDGSPKPMLYPGNFEHDLVQMPFVANPRKSATDLVGKLLAELARPLSDGFVADNNSAGRQQLLHHAQPEREAEIQPHGMSDDLGREPIPSVAGASGWPHPIRLLTPICLRKRGNARQVDGAVLT
jgi:hypothetical protein